MGFGGRGWGRGWGGTGIRAGAAAGAARRGRRRVFDAGELRLVLLKLIADQPRHGYDLIRAIEEMTHGTYAPSPGVVYPTLTMLQDMGLIEEAKGEGSRKAFQVTAEGKAHLAEKAGGGRRPARAARRTSAATSARPAARRSSARSAICSPRSGTAPPARMSDEGTLHKIAAILDEAAQKIERLRQ